MIFGVFSVIAIAVLCDFSQSFVLDENSNKLYDFDWQCDTICLGSGGRARFDPKNKICKCIMDKKTNEKDLLLMQKNAKDMGLQIITCNHFKELEKREINEKQLNTVEENVEIPKPSILKNLNEKFSSFSKKINLTPTHIVPFDKTIETPVVDKKTVKTPFNITARFYELQDIQRKKMSEMMEQGLFPHIKSRSSFKEVPKITEETKTKSSEIQKAMALVKQKQNDFMEKFKSRKSNLLASTNFQKKNKITSKSHQPNLEGTPAQSDTLAQANSEIYPEQNIGLQHQSAVNNEGIILQPPGTYDD